MSQYDFGTIDPFVNTGEQLADMLNNWRDAIHSWHRGPTRPGYAVPGMMWVNDAGGPTSWIVNVYMGPTVGDVEWFSYDTTTGAIIMQSGMLLAQTAALPSMRWNATINGVDQKAWRSTVLADGTLKFSPYTDTGVEIAPGIIMRRDGKLIADLSGASGIPPSTVVGINPPPAPAPNQLWWKSDDGLLYVYYNDGNSSQWVPASPMAKCMMLGSAFTSDGGALRTIDNSSGLIPSDDTIPQVGEGTQLLSLTYTPKSATSRLRLRSYMYATAGNSAVISCAHFRDGAANAVASGWSIAQAASWAIPVMVEREIATGSIAPTTITMRVGVSAAGQGFYLNGSGGSRLHGGATQSTLSIEEYA